MEQQRNILLILFLVLSLFLYWNWESDKLASAQRAEQQTIRAEQMLANAAQDSSIGKLITLKSDSLALTLDLNGGDIVDARLLKVMQEQGKDDPFHLLMDTPDFLYIAQSGLVGRDGPDSKVRPTYTTDTSEYVLAEGQDSVSANLVYEGEGYTVTKTYTLHRAPEGNAEEQRKDPNNHEYLVDVTVKVDNHSGRELSMGFYGQLKQTVDNSILTEGSNPFGMVAAAYRGSAYSTAESRYEKERLEDLIDLANERNNLNVTTTGGWVSMIQHYFVAAWIGDKEATNTIYSNQSAEGRDAIIGIMGAPVTIADNSTHEFKTQMWIGPKSQDQMETVAPNLDLTVDYGWLWFLSIPLFKILEFIHSFVGNWGFSIILLTIIVRSVLFPLTKAQYTSMAKMRLLTPKMQELRERYKDDRQKLGQETMKLYKSEKVNPMGGCLPLLIQMPIFIALYWTLMESTELRHAPFILWITDLSVYDPYFVTPILYGISMFFIQKMSPTPVNDPIQRKVIMAMPLIFTFMFCTFPAGLTVYWVVSNCFTIFQQVIIYRSLEKRGLHVRTDKNAKNA